jgi:uroporphyrinogen III methyltransferase/synthase
MVADSRATPTSGPAPSNGTGTVYLVGAGPGDPGLLTLRGEALLRRAEVVVYDRLVSPALLDLCGPSAKLEYVGKEAGRHPVRQKEINRRLVEYARSGRRVVRLKGGDPFVFGRGGEEALALRAAGVPFEVVPGITSALAAPACAGIPVTHRGLASSVAIATGHEDPTKVESAIAWSELAAGADTLVFLMGTEQLATITQQLIAAGRSAEQPAAVVRWGTTTEQETVFGRLDSIADAARERCLRPPAVLVVGAVVDLARELAWLERRPLHGRRVLVTRARDQASALTDRLAELGALPLEFPAIRIEPLEDPTSLDRAVARLAEVDWVVFTSANGVRAAFQRLEAAGRDARAFGQARVAAIGPATTAALAERGVRADFVPVAFTSDAIASELAPSIRSGNRVLLLRADIAPPSLADRLASLGAVVENVTAYRTVPDAGGRDEVRQLLRDERIDVVTFTSSSTVRNLVDGLEGETGLLARPLIACIGPVTAATAVDLGLRVDIVAAEHTVGGLIEALVQRLAQPAQPVEVSP